MCMWPQLSSMQCACAVLYCRLWPAWLYNIFSTLSHKWHDFRGGKKLLSVKCSFAPSHTSVAVQQFLAEKSVPVITQPPYSPDLAPSDFWLFSTLKMVLKGTRFATMEDIEWNVTAELQEISKEAFRRCFQQWQDRWSKCVCAQGSYFEGVSVVVCPTITVLHHISGNFLTAPTTSKYKAGGSNCHNNNDDYNKCAY